MKAITITFGKHSSHETRKQEVAEKDHGQTLIESAEHSYCLSIEQLAKIMTIDIYIYIKTV